MVRAARSTRAGDTPGRRTKDELIAQEAREDELIERNCRDTQIFRTHGSGLNQPSTVGFNSSAVAAAEGALHAGHAAPAMTTTLKVRQALALFSRN
jgi:hypothetical protein